MKNIDETLEAKGLPRVAFYIHPSEPGTVIRLYRGEKGYKVEVRLDDYADARELKDTLNAGISHPEVEAMMAGSMFGWNCPAADPASYEEDGTFRQVREYDIAFQGRVKVRGRSYHQACAAAAEKMIKAGVDPLIRWGGSVGKVVKP